MNKRLAKKQKEEPLSLLFVSPDLLNPMLVAIAEAVKKFFHDLLTSSASSDPENLMGMLEKNRHCLVNLQILYTLMKRRTQEIEKSRESESYSSYFKVSYVPLTLFTEALEAVEKWKKIIEDQPVLKEFLKRSDPKKFKLLFGKNWAGLKDRFLATFRTLNNTTSEDKNDRTE